MFVEQRVGADFIVFFICLLNDAKWMIGLEKKTSSAFDIFALSGNQAFKGTGIMIKIRKLLSMERFNQ